MQIIANQISLGGVNAGNKTLDWRFERIRGRGLGILNFSFKEFSVKKSQEVR